MSNNPGKSCRRFAQNPIAGKSCSTSTTCEQSAAYNKADSNKNVADSERAAYSENAERVNCPTCDELGEVE